MLKKIRFPQKTYLGIDIGTYSIKVLEASVGQEKVTITKAGSQKLPLKYSQKDIASAFKLIQEKAAFQAHDVRISLSGPNVTVRFINMPRMSPADLKNSLKYEADKYIPFGIDEVVIDSCILSREGEDSSQMRVLLSAAKKDIIQKRIDLFKELGYAVRLIDVDAFALFNAFSLTASVDDAQSVALVNIGHSYTNVIVARGGSPFFARDIHVGGEEILKSAALQRKINEEEAEKVMLSIDKRDDFLTDIIKTVFSSMAEEIRLSFGYYENQYGRSIDRIFVSGGLAGDALIGELFNESFGITPEFWNPLDGFVVGEGVSKDMPLGVRSSLAVGCGLVARKV